ncbi:unnamed protein product [Brassica oleracea]
MKICTIEISHSLSNPTDAFRYVIFLCSSRQLESRPLFKHGGGASSENELNIIVYSKMLAADFMKN